MPTKRGKIVIESGANVWPHEMDTAKAFAAAGYTVEFMRRSEGRRVTTADVVIDGVVWEIKSPESHQLKVIEKNIRAALHQSRDVIFDCHRMKKLENERIEREVRKWARELSSVRRLFYVNRRGEVVKIK